MTDERLFEQQSTLENLDGDLELLQLLARTFIADAPRLLGQMRSALDEGPAEAAARACHNTKGSVANFGADALVSDLKAMEAACRRGERDQAAAMYARIEQAMLRLVAELGDACAGTPH